MNAKKSYDYMQEKIADLKERTLGLKLIQVAAKSAVKAGDANGEHVFVNVHEMFSMNEDFEFMYYAGVISRLWLTAETSEELAGLFAGIAFTSTSAEVAASLLVEHRDEVQRELEFELGQHWDSSGAW